MEIITKLVGETPILALYKKVKIDMFGFWAGQEYEVIYNKDYTVWKFCDGIYGMSYPCYANALRELRGVE